VLAGLARETERIRLGVLVSPVTFRLPGTLAKIVATVDEMSGGRVEFGLGAGWHALEHAQLGLPFPEIADRGDMLEESLQALLGLWGEPDGWSFEGRHIQISDAQFYPKPVAAAGRPTLPNGASRPRILVGGGGTPRSIRIAARFADEFNLSSSSPAVARDKYAQLDAACREAGRDPSTVTKSTMSGVLIGRDGDEVRRRQHDLLRDFGNADAGEEWFHERTDRWIFGTPDEARAQVERFAEAGAERIMLQDFLPRDLDMVDLMAEALF
jgi:alkanesulfonate monooxygenase SsuD/methylene tetrahydromethanopterin reductase-like flavin-dependent oxidoreductase (luciferase family)